MIREPLVGVRLELTVQPRQRARLLKLPRKAGLGLLGLQAAAGTLAAYPARQGGARHAKEPLHFLARRASFDRRDGTQPQIQRVRLCHRTT